MGQLKRQERVIVAIGGSCPALERLSNGDLLVAYRDETKRQACVSLTRSTDGGLTWKKEHTFDIRQKCRDPHHPAAPSPGLIGSQALGVGSWTLSVGR